MFLRSLVLLCLCGITPMFAAGQTKALSTFDVYVAPYFAPNFGSYKAGTVESGSTTAFQYGARIGFKMGPILLGGEFGGAYLLNDSTQLDMTTADEQKYAIDSKGELLLAGLHLGIISDRWLFMTTYYPVSSFEAKSNAGSANISATYTGFTYSAEIDLRVYNRLYVGAIATKREFNKFTSGALTKAALDPKLEALSYGIVVSYLVPFSDFGKLPKIFQGL